MTFLIGTNSATPWFNVRTDFGAVGNGSADDTAAINAAIAAANADSLGGKIFFPPGYYRVTGALTTITRSGTSIVGSGEWSSVISIEGNPPEGDDNGILSFIGADGAPVIGGSIQDITLQCNSSAVTRGCILAFDYVNDFHVDRVSLNVGYNGIFIRQCSNLRIANMRNARLRGNYGIKLYGTNTSRKGGTDKVFNLTLDNFLVGAESPFYPTYSVIGLLSDGKVENVSMINAAFLKNSVGMKITNTPGVAFPAFSSLTSHSFVSEFGGLDGIEIENSENLYFTSCYLLGSSTANGIFIKSNARNISIAQSKSQGNKRNGIVLGDSTVQNIYISDTYCNGNGPSPSTGSGIVCGAANGVVIKGCTCTFNNGYGIQFETSNNTFLMQTRLTDNPSGPMLNFPSTLVGQLEGVALTQASSPTDGFLNLPVISGIPTGTPLYTTGASPMVINTATGTGQIRVRIGGVWRTASLT